MWKELGMAVALVSLCGLVTLVNDSFLNPGNITNTSRQIGMLGVLALGAAFVIIGGGIDLSVGSIVALTAVILVRLSGPADTTGAIKGLGYHWSYGVSAALAAALLIGLIQGLLITRLGLQPFIVTLCGMMGIRGLAQTMTQGGSLSLGASDFKDLTDQGITLPPVEGGIIPPILWPYPLWIFLGLLLFCTYLLHFTVFGRHLFAIGGNKDAARFSGVPVQRVETFSYVISAGLAGVAGLLNAAYAGQVTHGIGATLELRAIAAAVLGGCSLRGGEGSTIGMFLGAAIIQIMDNGINQIQPKLDVWIGGGFKIDYSREIVIGLIILAAVLLDRVAQVWRERRPRRGK